MGLACNWHRDEVAIRMDEAPCCPRCGILIQTEICESCCDEYIDWRVSGWDDVAAGPAVDEHGDFCCMRCWTEGATAQAAEEQDELR